MTGFQSTVCDKSALLIGAFVMSNWSLTIGPTNSTFSNTFFKFVQGIARLQRHQQIVDEVKLGLKPFYIQGKITKDDYKLIMKKSVEKVCVMFVLGDHLLKLKQNWCAMQVSSMLQTWCTQVENLECGRFVLYQCKNKIARASEIPHIVCAYCLVSQGYSHSLFVVRLNIKLNKTRVCSCVSPLFQGQGKFVVPKKKSVAKKGTLNNFNSYLNTRPNQSWATMVETSALNNTPLLLPKNYFYWYFFNSNT